MIEIRPNNGSLDLLEGVESSFYINKIVHDLSNLETRESDSSNTFDVPYTINNLRLLGLQLPEFGASNKNSYKLIPATVLMGGVSVIKDAQLLVHKVTKSNKGNLISIGVFSGITLFYNALSEGNISELNFEEYDIDWNLNNLEILAKQTDGIVYADANWFSNESILLFRDEGGNDSAHRLNTLRLDTSGFFIYLKTVLYKIFDGLNFDFDLSVFENDELFNKWAVSCPVTQIFDRYKTPVGYLSKVRYPPNDPLYVEDGRLIVGVPFSEVITDLNGLWSGNNYLIAADNYVELTLNITDTTVFGGNDWAGDTIFRIYMQRLGTIAEYRLPPNEDTIENFSLTLSVKTQVQNLDNISVRINAGSSYTEYKLKFFGSFEIKTVFETPPNLVSVSDWLPEISQKVFVKEVFKLMHIVPIQKGTKIGFDKWDNIIERKSQDLTKNLNLESDIKESGVLANYGTNNIFRYANNDTVVFAKQKETLVVKTDYLADVIEKLVLFFSATDETAAKIGTENDKVSVPLYNIFWEQNTDNNISITNGGIGFETQEKTLLKEGDIIFIDNGSVLRRVVNMTDDVTGQVDVAWPHGGTERDWHFQSFDKNNVLAHLVAIEQSNVMSIIDGGFERVVQDPMIATFTDEHGMPNIVDLYYDNFRESIKKPIILSANFNFSVTDFILLDLLRPIYLQNYAKKFYINKIEQYKENGECRLELVSILGAKEKPTDAEYSYTLEPENDIDWGDWKEGDPLPETTYILTNTGNIAININVTLEGNDPNEFEIVGDTQHTIPVGQVSNFIIRYGGNPIEGNYSCQVVSNAVNSDIKYRGISINVQDLITDYTFEPVADVDLGDWREGDPLPEITYTLQNTGEKTVVINLNRAGANPNEFEIVGDTQHTIPVGQISNFIVRYGGNVNGGIYEVDIVSSTGIIPNKTRNVKCTTVQLPDYQVLPETDTDWGDWVRDSEPKAEAIYTIHNNTGVQITPSVSLDELLVFDLISSANPTVPANGTSDIVVRIKGGFIATKLQTVYISTDFGSEIITRTFTVNVIT